jgi:hypothetical protein
MTPRRLNSASLLLAFLLTACGSGGSQPAPNTGGGPVNTNTTPPCPFSKIGGGLPGGTGFAADTAAPPSPTSNATSAGRIYFDAGLSPQERGAFVSALGYLDHTQGLAQDPTLLSYMHLSTFDRASVRGWLEDHVQYIAAQNFDDSKLVKLRDNYRDYQFANQLPTALAGCAAAIGTEKPAGMITADGSGGEVVMSNVGTLIYLLGKVKHELFGVQADGLGTIQMVSPRAGVLQIGTGLFMVPETYPNVVRMFQLTTLLHEARHSDGHGVTAGFLHATCPSGDYAGTAACDNNLNGPYEIETMAMKTFMTACTSCTTKESKILQVLYVDTASRRIDAGATVWDDAPEGHR